MGIYRDF